MPAESAQRPTSVAPIHEQPPIFVISLATDEERRARIVAALEDLGLRCTLIDAVDARQGVPPDHETSIDRVAGASLSEPEYGCALSHALIYRRMVAEQVPHAIVLEEDAIPTSRFAQFVRDEEYRSSPLIQLYHQAAYVRRSGARSLTGGVELARLATSCSGTVAYSLDLEAAVALEAAALLESVAAGVFVDTFIIPYGDLTEDDAAGIERGFHEDFPAAVGRLASHRAPAVDKAAACPCWMCSISSGN